MALTALQSVKTCLREHVAASEANLTDDDTQSLVPLGSEFEEILDNMLDMVTQKVHHLVLYHSRSSFVIPCRFFLSRVSRSITCMA